MLNFIVGILIGITISTNYPSVGSDLANVFYNLFNEIKEDLEIEENV